MDNSQADEESAASRPPWNRSPWRKRLALIATPAIAIGLLIALLIWYLPSALGASAGVAQRRRATSACSRTTPSRSSIPVPTASSKRSPSHRVPTGSCSPRMGITSMSDGASTVSVIDTATNTVTNSIEVGKTPHGLAITPDGEYVLVAGFGTDQVSIIVTKTNQVTGHIPVAKPHNFAISRNGQMAYVSSQHPGTAALAMVNIEGKSLIGSIPLDHISRALNFSPDGKRLYFTQEQVLSLQVLDSATSHIIAQLPVVASPRHLLLMPRGDLGLVVVQGPSNVRIFDPAKSSVIANVSTGLQPHWIATSADDRTAWVTNESSNDVAVVDLGSHQVTAHIPIGNGPRKIAVQQGRQSMGSAASAALLSIPVVPK